MISLFVLSSCNQINSNQLSDSYTTDEESEFPVLLLYTDLPAEKLKFLSDVFIDKFNIKLEVESIGSEQVIRKLVLEKDNPKASLVMLSNADRLNRLAKAGLLQPTTSNVFTNEVPEYFSHPDKLWIGLSYSPRVIVYSKERVDPRKINYYIDLSRPLWQGRLLMGSSEDINNQELVGNMLLDFDEKEILEWSKGIAKNTLYGVMDDDESRIKNISKGKGDLAVVETKSLASMQYTGNADEKTMVDAVDVLEPENNGNGASIKITGIAKVANTGNAKLADIFITFMLERDQIEQLASALYEFPTVKEATVPDEILKWAEIKIDTSSQFEIAAKKQKVVEIMDEAGWK